MKKGRKESWGGVPGWHLPCLIPLDPFPCWRRGDGRAGWVLRVPKEVWKGRWASPSFFLCRMGQHPRASCYLWHKVLGVGLGFAAGKRKCFGVFGLFLMCFLLLDLTVCGKKLIWNLWVFFLQENHQVWKLIWVWGADTHKLQQVREMKLACEMEFFCICQPGLFNIYHLTTSIKLIKAQHNIRITIIISWHHQRTEKGNINAI